MKIEVTDDQVVRMSQAIGALREMEGYKAQGPGGFGLRRAEYEAGMPYAAMKEPSVKNRIEAYQRECQTLADTALADIRAIIRKIADGESVS